MTRILVVLFFFILQAACSFSRQHNLVGLKNYGETCYANAVFQLLYHNDDFRGSLEKYLGETPGARDQHLVALNGLFSKMDTAAAKTTINPPTFEALPGNFTPNLQYDITEVLEKYQKIVGLDWRPFAVEIRETINRLGRTQLFLELFLTVPEDRNQSTCPSLTLQNLLNSHFSNGKEIETLPRNLLIRIKRIHNVNGADEKIVNEISVPESLSLAPWTRPSTNSQYQLTTFIEHCGNCTTDGHYLLYLHHSGTGAYFSISDENVRQICREEFIKKASRAYLFLYKQSE